MPPPRFECLRPQDPLSEFFPSQAVSKRLNTVNRDHWNIVFVAFQKVRIRFNVHLLKRVFIWALSCADRLLGLITEVTIRAGVDDYARF